MSGLAPSNMCAHWLKQCFWNYLDWADVAAYACLCVLFGADYQTYFCVALLRHLNNTASVQKIAQHHTYKDLHIYLKESQVHEFCIGVHMEYMRELEHKYRKYIYDDINQNIFQSNNNVTLNHKSARD